MNNILVLVLIFLLSVCLIIILYQRFVYIRGMRKTLRKISQKLSEILETDSEEKLMEFTEDRELIEVMAQINSLLIDRQKIRVDYKKEQMASKKMLSNISHDIKTPLTVILGYLEIMRLNNQQDEMLCKVEIKTKQVLEMINEFFTLAKLEAGDASIQIQKINLTESCRESVLGFYELLLQKEYQVDIVIPERKIYVQGESEAIQRILYNLITNAIRYGSDGNYLGVRISEDNRWAYIEIIDKGKGIEKESAAQVFDRLYTMEDSRNRNIQGNGLGLTIAKNLAMQMGGDIFLDSEPGVRTVFTVKLKKIHYETLGERKK